MEEYLTKVARILAVKNNLVLLEDKELEEKCSSFENFVIFVNSVYELVCEDKKFFCFSSLKEETLNIFSLHRYDKNLSKDLITKINYVISTFNSMQITDSEELKNEIIDYCTNEIILRDYVFKNEEDLIKSITFDIDVFISILEENLEQYKDSNSIAISMDLEQYEDENMVLASLHYFGKVFPTMYQDEDIKEVVSTYLEMIKNKKGLFRGPIKTYAKAIEEEFL